MLSDSSLLTFTVLVRVHQSDSVLCLSVEHDGALGFTHDGRVQEAPT